MKQLSAEENPLLEYLQNNPGRLIDKWVHYFDIYHRHLARFRGQAVTLVEFGVLHGGSLQMWKHYLGTQARIIGVDINPLCLSLAEEQVAICIGDQSDRSFLRRLAEEVGQIDVVIEDGGHFMGQQIATFEEIYFRMSESGLYITEDMHTSYWARYGGGVHRPGTFIEYAKGLIDRIHAWHTEDPNALSVDDFTLQTASLHFYDSVLVIERMPVEPPQRIKTGKPSFPQKGL
jgi:cephalosporin hydroxylase